MSERVSLEMGLQKVKVFKQVEADYKRNYVIKQLQNKYGIHTDEKGCPLYRLDYRNLVYLLARQRALYQ